MIKTLCRSDKTHWCIECCRPHCPLLGNIGKDIIGCLGRDGKGIPLLPGQKPVTQPPLCQKFNCLAYKRKKTREKIRQFIITLPPGQFKMSEVLAQMKEIKREKMKGG